MAEAGVAARPEDHRTRLGQGPEQPLGRCLRMDLRAARADIERDVGRDAPPPQNCRGGAQILDAVVGTGTDRRVIHARADDLAHRDDAMLLRRHGDEGLQRAEVVVAFDRVDRVGVGNTPGHARAGTAHEGLDEVRVGVDLYVHLAAGEHVLYLEAVAHPQVLARQARRVVRPARFAPRLEHRDDPDGGTAPLDRVPHADAAAPAGIQQILPARGRRGYALRVVGEAAEVQGVVRPQPVGLPCVRRECLGSGRDIGRRKVALRHLDGTTLDEVEDVGTRAGGREGIGMVVLVLGVEAEDAPFHRQAPRRAQGLDLRLIGARSHSAGLMRRSSRAGSPPAHCEARGRPPGCRPRGPPPKSPPPPNEDGGRRRCWSPPRER